ncbi:MAG TPA: helix-turn-helix domain-containing protein [Lacipirellulaceae bacterium]|jgi:AraC-like DNA-binding protein
MDAPQPHRSLIRFSADNFPEKDRVEAFREIYGRTILNVDVQPNKDEVFHCEMSLRALPDIGIGLGFSSAATYRRTLSLRQDDELLFFVVLSGHGSAVQSRREAHLADGAATLLSGADTGATIHPSNIRYLSVALSRNRLAPMIPDMESSLARPIPAENSALQLLVGYAQTLQQTDLALSSQVRQVASTHIYDLAAVVLGATRDVQEAARHRGVRAARLRAIKDDIGTHLASRGLSVDALAARHKISARYIRSLFESDETTFTDFVLSARLSRARQLLILNCFTSRTIGSISADAGFSDLSHFNRNFRLRYGMTPSDLRALARREEAAK